MIGQTLGAYRITTEVARGGQATLYKAVHTVLGRETALKVLHPHLITVADFLQKFEAESKILAQLKHPNIVAVYDAGVDQGLYWIAMEWLDGQAVDNLIDQQGKLPVDLAVRIADQVATALGYAHAQGLIHRDIKPANMMLLPNGTVKVLDFGIAAIVAAGQKAVTRIGTVEYMSYEQFNGQADHRSDIYSLGASLYEMLTGQLPPRLALHPPTPPSQLNPAIPPGLEQLLYRLLAQQPEDRPQTTAQFQQQLHAALTGRSVQPMPIIFCPHCKAMNRVGASYCMKCGDLLIVDGADNRLKIRDIRRVAAIMSKLHHPIQKVLWVDDRSIAIGLFWGDADLFFIGDISSPTVQRITLTEFSQLGTKLQMPPEISPSGKWLARMLDGNTLQLEDRQSGRQKTLKVGVGSPLPLEVIMWLDAQRVLIGVRLRSDETPEASIAFVHIVDVVSGLTQSWPLERYITFDFSDQEPNRWPGDTFLLYSCRGSIQILEPTSGKETRITNGVAPQWSPNGQHIAFLRSPKEGEYELWVMRVEPA